MTPKKKGPKPRLKDAGQFNLIGESADLEKAKKKAKSLGWSLSEAIMILIARWIGGEIKIERKGKK